MAKEWKKTIESETRKGVEWKESPLRQAVAAAAREGVEKKG